MSSSYTVKPGLVPILLLKPCADLFLSVAQKLKVEIWQMETHAELSQYCLSLHGALIILHFQNQADVAAYLRLLKEIRTPLSQNRVRILLILSIPEDELLEKMSEYGFSESVREGTPEKTLLFKLAKLLKQVFQQIQAVEGLEVTASPVPESPTIELSTNSSTEEVRPPPKVSSLAVGLLLSEMMSKSPPMPQQKMISDICELMAKATIELLAPVEFWLVGASGEWNRVSDRRFLEIEDGKNLEEALLGPKGSSRISQKFRIIPVSHDGVKALWVCENRNTLSDRYFVEVFRFMRGILTD